MFLLTRGQNFRVLHSARSARWKTVAHDFSWAPSAAYRRRKGHALNFSPGQVVVHPHHGPATIKKVASRTIRGNRVKYLKLEVTEELLVSIPVEKAEEIG